MLQKDHLHLPQIFSEIINFLFLRISSVLYKNNNETESDYFNNNKFAVVI